MMLSPTLKPASARIRDPVLLIQDRGRTVDVWPSTNEKGGLVRRHSSDWSVSTRLEWRPVEVVVFFWHVFFILKGSSFLVFPGDNFHHLGIRDFFAFEEKRAWRRKHWFWLMEWFFFLCLVYILFEFWDLLKRIYFSIISDLYKRGN